MKHITIFTAAMAIGLCASATDTYTNPVIPKSLPDPTVMRAADGTFYLFATENTRNVPIYRSANLVDWTFAGTAFTDATRPQWNPKGAIWAPDINETGGKYLLYYSKSEWGGEWTCGIGVATADAPQGPYIDRGPLFISNEIGVQNCIDPFYIEDNGHKYLFWGSFHGIYGSELTDDGLALRSDAGLVKIAGDFMEATYIHRHDGYYYLFGSAGRCCEGERSTYRVTVGRSENLRGPYTDRQGRPLTDNHHEVILSRSESVIGPGHNSEIITDAEGNDWILYHGFSADCPDKGRLVFLDRVSWVDGWPVIAGGTPSENSPRPRF